MRLFLRFAVLGLLSGVASPVRAEGLPNPKTGGLGGGPISILILSGEPTLDKTYEQRVIQEGFAVTTANYLDPYKLDFFKKFNVIVLDTIPAAGAEWDTFGQKMLYYWSNIKHVEQCLREGAGVLVYAYTFGGGGFGGWNQEMKRWGVQVVRASIRDNARSFSEWSAYGKNVYCWTENLTKHPITEGLRRIYYPSANLRWDEFYTSPPLILDKEWTPLVKAMAGSHAERAAGNVWSVAPDEPADLVLAAVRTVDKGRMGVISCDPGYIHRFPYLNQGNYGETSYAPATGINGIILEKGDGTVPSDLGTLVSRVYAWLANNSGASGFGGYKMGDAQALREPFLVTREEKDFKRVIDWDNPPAPPSWRHRAWAVERDKVGYYPEVSDPLVQGELKFLKALVGVHTACSDGTGSVREYAEAARRAGYRLICFAEAFEALSRDGWRKLVADCEVNTTADFACLPGYDIMDRDGNHMIVIAAPEYPHASWLTPDGKRVEQVQMLNLGYYNHKTVAHKACSSEVLPYERLKHFQGLSVYTYHPGKLVDDSLKAYAWQAMNGSSPQPIVVHEVFKPSEVEDAARTGFQQLMPADTLRNAVSYFRIGLATFFEAPARYLISEGPIVHRWVVAGCKDTGPLEENRQQFRMLVGAKSDVPLKSVTLYDGFTPVRHWLPTGNDFEAAADFRHCKQYGLYLVVEDSQGRRAITAPVRTVADRFHFRCSDRQNWLGHTGFHYPGTWLPEHLDIAMPIKGTDEGSRILVEQPGACMAVKLNFPFSAGDVVLTEAILEDVYTYAVWKDIGFDAMPSRASRPSTVYGGRLRHWNFTPGVAKQPYVTLVEIELKLKRDVEPVEGKRLWPAFGGLSERKFCRPGLDGRLIVGDVAGDADVRVGTLAGGYIPLTDGLRIEKGSFGLVAPKTPGLTMGTTFRARFLVASGWRSYSADPPRKFDDDPEGWLKGMGFAGPTPYVITMERGTLNKVQFIADVSAKDFGAAGEVATPAQIPYWVPLQVHDANPNWVAGVWQEGDPIRYAGVFENAAWPRLDVSRKGSFYAGNLLTANNRNLVLQLILWTKHRIKVEVHNPTATSITAKVSSPKEIEGLKRLNAKVVVPAGSTVYLDSPAPGRVQ